ncbi:MAG: DUF3841 domain-containing protein [Tissierellaceae bacterium]
MGKVRLWTRQDSRSLRDLEDKGVHRIQRWYIEEQFEDIANHYIPLYHWFVDKASKIVPKPENVEFPIWCSISDKSMLRPTEDSLVYVIEIDEDEVIYFDGRKWDYVLNHLYLAKDEEDLENYRKEIKRKGLKDSFSFIDGKYANFYPLEKKKIMDSWMRVFEIEDWDIFGVQANIWEIRKDMVKDIIYHKG